MILRSAAPAIARQNLPLDIDILWVTYPRIATTHVSYFRVMVDHLLHSCEVCEIGKRTRACSVRCFIWWKHFKIKTQFTTGGWAVEPTCTACDKRCLFGGQNSCVETVCFFLSDSCCCSCIHTLKMLQLLTKLIPQHPEILPFLLLYCVHPLICLHRYTA